MNTYERTVLGEMEEGVIDDEAIAKKPKRLNLWHVIGGTVSAIYTLRPASDNDYDFLYNLHVAAIKPSVETTWGWDDAFQAEYFRSRWDPSKRQIICVNGVDVGTIKLEQRPKAIFLALIEVHPDYQGQGIGTEVIRDVLANAHGRGLNVELNVLKTNPKAKRLYERLGFVITEDRKDRYVMVAPSSDADS